LQSLRFSYFTSVDSLSYDPPFFFLSPKHKWLLHIPLAGDRAPTTAERREGCPLLLATPRLSSAPPQSPSARTPSSPPQGPSPECSPRASRPQNPTTPGASGIPRSLSLLPVLVLPFSLF